MEAICFVSCLMIGFPPRYQCYLLRLKLFLSFLEVFSLFFTHRQISLKEMFVSQR